MRLNNIRVSHKLWAIVITLLLAMLVLNVAISKYMGGVEAEATAKVEQQSRLIAVAMKWKVIVERNSAMTYAMNFTTDKPAADFFGETLKQYIAESGGIQKYLVENADTTEDKQAIDAIGKDRA